MPPYATPDPDPESDWCTVSFELPAAQQPVLIDALRILSEPEAWRAVGSETPIESAQVFDDILATLTLDCGQFVFDEMGILIVDELGVIVQPDS